MKTYQVVQFALVMLEAAACVVGFLKWSKIKNTYWRLFPFYLALTVICEIIGLSMIYFFNERRLSENFYGYLVIPIEFLFYYWLYYQYLKNSSAKYWPLCGAAIYFLSWLTNILFFPKTAFWSMPFSYMAGVVILFVLIMLFFFKFISSNDILGFKTSMMFWISLGLLIFFLVSSPFFAMRGTLYAEHPGIFYLYYYLQFGVNYLMYTFFIVSFVWGKTH